MSDPNYESFLVCEHKDIIAFYVRGLEVAIYHKENGFLDIKDCKTEDYKKIKKAYCSYLNIFARHDEETL